MPVLEALRRLAIQIGWDIRTFPSLPGFPTGYLVFYGPDRALAGGAAATIPPSEYLAVREMAVDDDDVRNVWKVWYNSANGEPEQFVTVSDATSIGQYGRKFAEVSEDGSSEIDTSGEALTMANAALADTKDPFASHVIELPLWPYVELNDIQAYPANAVHYDAQQTFAVVSYEHSFTAGAGRTVIKARGKPIAAYRGYRYADPRTVHVSLISPPALRVARDRAVWYKVPSLAFP